MRLTNIRLIIAVLLVFMALSAQRSDDKSLGSPSLYLLSPTWLISNQAIRSPPSTQPSYPVATVRPEPFRSNPTTQAPGLRARLWSLAAKIPWIGPRFFVGHSEQSIAVMATGIATWSITTVVLVKDVTIYFFQVHVVDYYRRTARYIHGVHQDEEMLQQQAQTASEGPSQLTKGLALRPSKQTRIARVAAQAGFHSDEVVPYPALLLEPCMRTIVQYRYQWGFLQKMEDAGKALLRGSLQTMEDAGKALLRKIDAWFGKLKLWVYRILGFVAFALIMWILSILAPLIAQLIGGLKGIAIILRALIDAPSEKLVFFVVGTISGSVLVYACLKCFGFRY
ncbi:MAG: hypothetical protein Q9180_009012 [Flavoplaca navasiana]